ncbi:MAG: putative transcriptional regulatory protein [Planctomycetaceae bacterium]|nr:MAG: putative transcriptional regulatory protein [Planctomycetaceae bacterium]
MAGHSHWANIAFKKGIADKKRGKLFGKLARAIIVAARRGGDPASNLALRYAIDRARKASMPNDTIEKAIKKGTGELTSESYDEVLYEGYGPGGVAVMCDILTDNRNRTAGELRKIFEVHGGNLGTTGCVAWMFERRGVFRISAPQITEERLLEVALEAGADDVRPSEQGGWEVLCAPDVFQALSTSFEAASIPTDSAEIMRLPNTTVELEGEVARAALKLMEALEDHDDVQQVTANFSISNDLLAELSAS